MEFFSQQIIGELFSSGQRDWADTVEEMPPFLVLPSLSVPVLLSMRYVTWLEIWRCAALCGDSVQPH